MAKSPTNIAEFQKQLGDFASKLLPPQVLALQKKLVFEIHRRVVMRTPVDSGHARRNWQVTVGAPAVGEVTGQAPPPLAALAGLQPFGVAFITNNVPYIEVIENGGWIPADPENSPEANKARAARRRAAVRKQARARVAQARGLSSARKGDAGIPLVKGGYSLQAPRGVLGVTLDEMRSIFP